MIDSSWKLEGATSFDGHEPSSACAYPKGSTRQREWIAGWVLAQGVARRAAGMLAARPKVRRPVSKILLAGLRLN